MLNSLLSTAAKASTLRIRYTCLSNHCRTLPGSPGEPQASGLPCLVYIHQIQLLQACQHRNALQAIIIKDSRPAADVSDQWQQAHLPVAACCVLPGCTCPRLVMVARYRPCRDLAHTVWWG